MDRPPGPIRRGRDCDGESNRYGAVSNSTDLVRIPGTVPGSIYGPHHVVVSRFRYHCAIRIAGGTYQPQHAIRAIRAGTPEYLIAIDLNIVARTSPGKLDVAHGGYDLKTGRGRGRIVIVPGSG